MARIDQWPSCTHARQILITGSVQGIGFRPALARLAASLNLKGSISNTTNGVELHLEGDSESLDAFSRECIAACPKTGIVPRITQSESKPRYYSALILEASGTSAPIRTCIPVDRNCCSTCINEVLEEQNKRYGYLLNTCSDCGPRYTLIRSMPFERAKTSLQAFPLCDRCLREYESVTDRRFHTQGIVCPQCGPQFRNVEHITEQLRAGQIVAVKGIGGYQFLVTASNKDPIEKLRLLKNRPTKPFVVMVSNITEARKIGRLTPLEEEALNSEAGPIVVVELDQPELTLTKRLMFDLSETWNSLTSGLHNIGLMLPSTPLHLQLLRQLGPLVVTSANRDGDPMITSDAEMEECGLLTSDRILGHDREIVRHADDSIVRVIADRVTTIRVGRGLGPLAISLHEEGIGEGLVTGAAVLAVGGHQKVAIALSNGYQSILGPHLGDMDNLKSRERFIYHVRDLLQLYGCEPKLVVHDLNPDYFTSRWAKEFANELGVASLGVQHHHAHVASGLWDTTWLSRRILGFSWDGTGYAADRSIWGGEVFLGTMDHLDRIASLHPFRLPGGELAIHEPGRIAESLLWETYGADIPMNSLVPNRAQIQNLIRRSTFAPSTTSAGRLFDGVAAMVFSSELFRNSHKVGYEGHWAMLLESMCRPKILEDETTGHYSMPIVPRQAFPESERSTLPSLVLDWRPLIRGIVEDVCENVSPSIISVKFHRALANTITSLGIWNRNSPILLTGGVFQNKVLVELIHRNCQMHDLEWSMPREIPVNDGGLAAGQLLLGLIHQRGPLCA
jgi:hydrogenase maturation protein HypF